jgi:hypothetical protein
VNRTGRREHAVALLLVGLLSGLVGLVAQGDVTPPVLGSLGGAWSRVFFACTFLSSLIALAGIFLPWSGVKGLYVEAGGLLIQAAAWTGYGLVVFALLGGDGFVFSVVTCGFSIAHIIRAFRIRKEARTVAAIAVAAGIVDPEEMS